MPVRCCSFFDVFDVFRRGGRTRMPFGGACDLRSNRSILPTTRQPLPRRPPAAATPHYTAICRRQTAAVCGTTAIDVHMCTAHSCPLRHHRNRQPPTTDVQTSAAAPPHWAAICRRQTAAVCGTTATDDHTYVVDGRTSRHHRTVQPSTDDKQLQSAAPPRSAATYSRQTDIHRGTAATDSHPTHPSDVKRRSHIYGINLHPTELSVLAALSVRRGTRRTAASMRSRTMHVSGSRLPSGHGDPGPPYL